MQVVYIPKGWGSNEFITPEDCLFSLKEDSSQPEKDWDIAVMQYIDYLREYRPKQSSHFGDAHIMRYNRDIGSYPI
jgi:hypothetical protein